MDIVHKQNRGWGYSLLRIVEAKRFLYIDMVLWPGDLYTPILRAVEPRLGRVHGWGQTICNTVNMLQIDVRKGFMSYLAFAICPKVGHHADNVVKTRVCALVDEKRTQRTQRVDNQAGFNRAMQSRTGEQGQRPFPCETNNSEDHVDNLQYGYGLDGAIEVLSEEIPEDLGPEEAVETSAYLI